MEKAVNSFATTLSAGINSSTTTIPVAAAAPAGLQSGEFRVRIDDELIIITAGQNGMSWTGTRGAEGTTAAAHSSGAAVTHVLTDASFELLVQQVIDANPLATDAEVAALLAAHVAAADPHPGYLLDSQRGAANGVAALDATGRVPIAQLASGAPDGTKFVRDDGTLATPPGGGAGGNVQDGTATGQIPVWDDVAGVYEPAAVDTVVNLNDLTDVDTTGVASGDGLVWNGSAWVDTPIATQAELDTASGALTSHLNDASDAHDASAVSFSPTGTIAATDVQAAIAEVASEAGGGGAASFGAVPNDVLVPIATGNLVMVSAAISGAANMMKVNRYVVRKTGTLKDVCIYVGGTSSAGNVRAAVYDVGVATTAVYTRLWDGASTGLASVANQWINMGDPDLAVTAGDHLVIGVVFSDNTAQFGRQIILSPSMELPAGFGPAPAGSGITPVWSAGLAQGAFTSPATISDATMLGGDTAVVHIITARVE